MSRPWRGRAWPRRLAAVALGMAAAVAASRAQVEASRTVDDEASQPFHVDAVCFAAGAERLPRVDVFIQVGYPLLSFVKRDDLYFATCELTLGLYDSSGSLVTEKLWNEEVKGVSYEESVSPTSFSLAQRSFAVKPGRYVVSVHIRVPETNFARRVSRQVDARDFFVGPLALSDILLVSRVTERGEKRSISPSVSGNLGETPGPAYLYVEVYNRAALADSARFVATVFNQKGEQKLEADTTTPVRDGRNERLIRLDASALPLGDYRVAVRVFRAGGGAVTADASPLAAAARGFVIRWMGVPRSLKDLDLAIDQVRYVAREDEFAKLKNAETVEQKQQAFLEFWKKRDPNPNTPRNEKMEEYYARVEYANRHFKHYIEGWRTDMGMVYIMFGPPNDVSRHPFEVDSKPYEIWRYYDLNYDFVFVDETGFGDYRLITPIWEVWKRVKTF